VTFVDNSSCYFLHRLTAIYG